MFRMGCSVNSIVLVSYITIFSPVRSLGLSASSHPMKFDRSTIGVSKRTSTAFLVLKKAQLNTSKSLEHCLLL